MEKCFKFLLVIFVFTFLSFNVSAVYYGDDRDKSTSDEEVKITLFDEGNGQTSPSSDEKIDDREYQITSIEPIDMPENGDYPVSSTDPINEGDVRITGTDLDANTNAESDNALFTTQSAEDNTLLTIILTGVSGLLIGSVITYFILAKRA